MKEDLKKLLILLVISIVLVIGSICLGGKVIMDMWNWFVVPTTNFSTLTYPFAIGLWVLLDGMIISNITSSLRNTIKGGITDEESIQAISLNISSLVLMLFTWGIGAIIHCCI